MTLNFDESGNALIVPLEIKLGRLDKLQDAVKKLREAKKDLAEVEPKVEINKEEKQDKDDKAKKQDIDLSVEEKSKKKNREARKSERVEESKRKKDKKHDDNLDVEDSAREKELDDKETEKSIFKEEKEIERADKKKIIKAFESGKFGDLTELEEQTTQKVIEKLNQEKVKNLSEITEKDFTSLIGKSEKEITTESVDAKDQMMETIKGSLTPEGVTNIIQMSKNPLGLVMRLMSNPVTAAIVAAIGAGVVMHKLLTMHGGVFDLNFKRVIVKETIKGRALAEKEAIRVGIGRGVVITTHGGSTTPEYEFNSFEVVRTGQMKNVRAFQIRLGYKY